MRSIRNRSHLTLLALGLAVFVACDAGDDTELNDMGDLDTTTPAAQPDMQMNTPVMTAQLEPAEGDEGDEVGGTVDVYRGDIAGAGGMDGGAMDSGEDMTGDMGMDENAAGENGMMADDPMAGQNGAMASGDGYSVAIDVTGLAEGEHAWHIHDGPCGEQAPVIIAFTPTPELEGLAGPLTAQADGMAADTAYVPGDNVPLDQLQGGQYSLHIHAQGGIDHGPTVACADLGQGSSGGMAAGGDTASMSM